MKYRMLMALALAGLMTAPASGQALQLLGKLRELGVTPQQAIGGATALLGVARGNLGEGEFSQLLSGAPELSAVMEMADGGGARGALGALRGGGDGAAAGSATAGGAASAAPVAAAAAEDIDPAKLQALAANPEVSGKFSELGMDAGLISQFVPTLLGSAGGSAGGLLKKGLGL